MAESRALRDETIAASDLVSARQALRAGRKWLARAEREPRPPAGLYDRAAALRQIQSLFESLGIASTITPKMISEAENRRSPRLRS
jgi:hypothetical protein